MCGSSGCHPWLWSWERTAHGPTIVSVGRQRIASHRGACEVRGNPLVCPVSVSVAEVIEQRLAQRSHLRSRLKERDGGLAMTGRPATANDVDGHERGRRVCGLGLAKSRSVREGASDRGTWGPSRVSRESGLGDSAVAGNTRPSIVTGAPESRRAQVGGRRKAAPDRYRVGRSARLRVKRSRPRRAIAVTERGLGARL